MRTSILSLLAVSALLCLSGCGNPEAVEDGTFRSGYVPSPQLIEGLADTPPAGELITIEPGGDTICSRGTPYRFFVRGGDSRRIVFDFAGGGACWDARTCSVADAIFAPDVPSQEAIERYYDEMRAAGIYEQSNPDNPIQGWTIVHLPYCTGDVHWGNALGVYDDGSVLVEHRGLVNARTTLAWAFDRYPDVEEILITGCSAGSYGSIGHSPWIADYYERNGGLENTKVSVLADSGAGIISDDFFRNSFPNWNAEEAVPEWIDGLGNVDVLQLDIVDLYTKVANHYPNARYAQYNAAFDADQEFFYEAMGGDPAEWSPKMSNSLRQIRSEADNFRYYLATGAVHCIHPYAMMYQRSTEGVDYASWLKQLISGDNLPSDVDCANGDCSADPICSACAMGGDGNWCRWCDR